VLLSNSIRSSTDIVQALEQPYTVLAGESTTCPRFSGNEPAPQ
jgi:hypothetical protein